MRAHADRLLAVRDRLVRPAVKYERMAKKAVRGSKVRIEIERVLEFVDRTVGLASGRMDFDGARS